MKPTSTSSSHLARFTLRIARAAVIEPKVMAVTARCAGTARSPAAKHGELALFVDEMLQFILPDEDHRLDRPS